MAFITERIDNSLLTMFKKNDKSIYSSEMDIKIHTVINQSKKKKPKNN
jgi:hypothetical protein